jgi:hypothetical protein
MNIWTVRDVQVDTPASAQRCYALPPDPVFAKHSYLHGDSVAAPIKTAKSSVTNLLPFSMTISQKGQ